MRFTRFSFFSFPFSISIERPFVNKKNYKILRFFNLFPTTYCGLCAKRTRPAFERFPLCSTISAFLTFFESAIPALKFFYIFSRSFHTIAEVSLMKIWSYVLFAVFLLAALFLYFVPTFIAFKNGRENKWAILLLNALLGVTILGWIGALLWSTSPTPSHQK